MSLSNYSENLMLNYLLNASAVMRPTAWYVQLHMTDPTDSGTGGTQPAVVNGDYARKAVTMAVAPVYGRLISNTNTVGWAADPDAAPYIFTHFSIWDAPTGGNCLATDSLSAPFSAAISVNPGGVLFMSPGKLAVYMAPGQ